MHDITDLPQLVTCDWLQFYCTCRVFDPAALESRSQFKVRDTERGTRVFRKVYEVIEKARVTSSRRDEKFAVLAMYPYSHVIDKDMVIVKIENRALYHANLYRRIVLMLDALGLVYRSITRLDIACDLACFVGGLHPLTLLERYRANEYIKRGSRSYCQWLTAPYSAATAPFKLGDQLAKAIHVTHSVSWGGATSDAHVKMYNKTREIKRESGKKYIINWWRKNGLVTDEDVWRVEISIGGRSRALVNNSSGEVIAVSLLEACSYKYLVATFLALANRHFAFYDVRGAKDRRHAKEVALFDVKSDVQLTAITAFSKPDPTRTAKVCINYLRNLPDEYDLGYFTKNYGEAAKAIYSCMCTLGEIYDELRIAKNGYEWSVSEYAKQRLADLQLQSTFGVFAHKSSVERIEDIVAVMESNDKRLQYEHELYAKFMAKKEAESPL